LLSGIIVEQFTPVVGAAWSWKIPFFVATIPGLILGALALRIVEPARGATEAFKIADQAREGSPYWRVLKIPTMWWIIISGALHNFNAYAVNAFLPAYLIRYHGLGLQKANAISGVTLGAVGVAGLLGGGAVADWARKKSLRGRMLLGAAAILTLTPLTYLALNRPKGDMVGFMILMGVGWMLFYVYYVTVYPTVQDVVEPSLRGTAMALYFFAMYVLGGAFGTTALGMLSDYFAKSAMTEAGATAMTEAFRAIGLHNAFFIAPVISLALAVVLFAASRTVASDTEKLQKWMKEAASKSGEEVKV
jgi:predicted MFS family arabinose efflux permease